MANNLLSPQEQQIHQVHPELSQLSQQDFLALKARLSVAGYLDDGAIVAADNIAQAYDKFKDNLRTSQTVQTSPGQHEEYLEFRAARLSDIGAQFKSNGLDIDGDNAQIYLEASRVLITDPGQAIVTRNGTYIEAGQIIDERIQKTLDNLIVSEGNSAQDIAIAQGVLRSFGIRDEDGKALEINGKDNDALYGAIESYALMKEGFFTLEESMGRSGAHWSDLDQDGQSDNCQDRNDDDANLYTTAHIAVHGEDLHRDLITSMNLDPDPKDPTMLQVKMIQGLLNTVDGAQLSVDGDYGPKSKAAIENFFRRDDVRYFIEGYDNINEKTLSLDQGLNYHHFEIIRNWAVANHEEVQNKIVEARDLEIENGGINGIMDNEYNKTVMDIQASMNMIGHLATMDGLYGGQTDGNINQFTDKSRDPDADFNRIAPAPMALR